MTSSVVQLSGSPIVVAVPFAPSDPSGASFDRLGIQCPPSIARCGRKRQIEFLFGRLAARHALRLLGHATPDAPIGIGDSRQPLWPAGVLGTLSHVHDLAVAAVTPITARAALGIDVEDVVGTAACAALTRRALDQDELRLIARAGSASSFRERVTIAFSAKESLFKAAFAEVGRWFGFTAARVSDFDAASGRLSLTIAESLSDGYRAGRVCDVRFARLRPGTVMTLYAPLAQLPDASVRGMVSVAPAPPAGAAKVASRNICARQLATDGDSPTFRATVASLT